MNYDIPMIRDFLDHLRLELELSIEHLHASSDASTDTLTADSDLVARLAQLGGKYDAALLPRLQFDTEDSTEEESRTVRKAVGRSLADERNRQLRHLNAITDLLDEALECAGQSATTNFPERMIPVRDVVERYRRS